MPEQDDAQSVGIVLLRQIRATRVGVEDMWIWMGILNPGFREERTLIQNETGEVWEVGKWHVDIQESQRHNTSPQKLQVYIKVKQPYKRSAGAPTGGPRAAVPNVLVRHASRCATCRKEVKTDISKRKVDARELQFGLQVSARYERQL